MGFGTGKILIVTNDVVGTVTEHIPNHNLHNAQISNGRWGEMLSKTFMYWWNNAKFFTPFSK